MPRWATANQPGFKARAGMPKTRHFVVVRLAALARPRTLANAAADTPCAGRFPVIRRVPRGDQFRRLRGRWHRDPLLARAAERFGTAVSRAEKGPESGGIRRHKFWGTCSLRSDDLGAAHTPQEPCFGSIPNMAKWHKRPQKAATLCHFLAACFQPGDHPRKSPVSGRATHGRHVRSERRHSQPDRPLVISARHGILHAWNVPYR